MLEREHLTKILYKGTIEKIYSIEQGFKHNFQSLRVVDYIETRCDDYRGINLTLAVREGILKHTKLTMDGVPVVYGEDDLELKDLRLDLPQSITLEGQIVAIADEIAQITHDLEDGIRSGIIDFNKNLMKSSLIGHYIKEAHIKNTENLTYDKKNGIIKGLVGFLIDDVCDHSRLLIDKYEKRYSIPTFGDIHHVFEEKCICFSHDVEQMASDLDEARDNWIIYSQEISQSDSKSKYIIEQIFKAYYNNPRELPDYILGRYFNVKVEDLERNFIKGEKEKELQDDPRFIRFICDHIAGMSDLYAVREYNELYKPKYI